MEWLERPNFQSRPIVPPSFELCKPNPDETIRPRVWQHQLIQLLRRRLSQPDTSGRDVLVHAGPGAGKTLGALLAFRSMRSEQRLDRFLVFCHRTSILKQWQLAAGRLGLTLAEWSPSPELESGDRWTGQGLGDADGWLVTYQGAGRQLEGLGEALRLWCPERLLAIADEAHHLGVDPEEPEGPIWGRTFLELSEGSRLRLGLTGTPFRADNLAFCAARKVQVESEGELVEQISPDLCVEPRELIAAGDVRPLEFRFQDGWVEHSREGLPDRDVSPLSAEQRESWRARNLRRAIRLSDSSSIALQLLLRARKQLEKVRERHREAAGLVIARDIDHARSITRLLEEEGDRVDLVHSQDPDASRRLGAFQKGNADWLVSIDMCAEGFDAPRLRVVAYLTTVVTRSRFLQGITRAVRMSGDRASVEAVPREPSFVFAPADPLLMSYARTWSWSEPYRIRSLPTTEDDATETGGNWRGPSLPLEAVGDGAGAVIQMRTPELPSFLQR
ncbi:DEAD/DEAH box helicase [Synechococcus sp. BS55D]|uniref:DEAD/DEAH box helicase n=1 Tax=Synechococcus sp. BS55D TaxID=2055943 RepID=UPI00103BA106|nr:DEAD/DEAH box helicase family protein [Synechococcus sp. BS55D]TCD56466.1 DEAD/DEAH box helicase [Synechococcus sp. BS55D]